MKNTHKQHSNKLKPHKRFKKYFSKNQSYNRYGKIQTGKFNFKKNFKLKNFNKNFTHNYKSSRLNHDDFNNVKNYIEKFRPFSTVRLLKIKKFRLFFYFIKLYLHKQNNKFFIKIFPNTFNIYLRYFFFNFRSKKKKKIKFLYQDRLLSVAAVNEKKNKLKQSSRLSKILKNFFTVRGSHTSKRSQRFVYNIHGRLCNFFLVLFFKKIKRLSLLSSLLRAGGFYLKRQQLYKLRKLMYKTLNYNKLRYFSSTWNLAAFRLGKLRRSTFWSANLYVKLLIKFQLYKALTQVQHKSKYKHRSPVKYFSFSSSLSIPSSFNLKISRKFIFRRTFSKNLNVLHYKFTASGKKKYFFFKNVRLLNKVARLSSFLSLSHFIISYFRKRLDDHFKNSYFFHLKKSPLELYLYKIRLLLGRLRQNLGLVRALRRRKKNKNKIELFLKKKFFTRLVDLTKLYFCNVSPTERLKKYFLYNTRLRRLNYFYFYLKGFFINYFQVGYFNKKLFSLIYSRLKKFNLFGLQKHKNKLFSNSQHKPTHRKLKKIAYLIKHYTRKIKIYGHKKVKKKIIKLYSRRYSALIQRRKSLKRYILKHRLKKYLIQRNYKIDQKFNRSILNFNALDSVHYRNKNFKWYLRTTNKYKNFVKRQSFHPKKKISRFSWLKRQIHPFKFKFLLKKKLRSKHSYLFKKKSILKKIQKHFKQKRFLDKVRWSAMGAGFTKTVRGLMGSDVSKLYTHSNFKKIHVNFPFWFRNRIRLKKKKILLPFYFKPGFLFSKKRKRFLLGRSRRYILRKRYKEKKKKIFIKTFKNIWRKRFRFLKYTQPRERFYIRLGSVKKKNLNYFYLQQNLKTLYAIRLARLWVSFRKNLIAYVLRPTTFSRKYRPYALAKRFTKNEVIRRSLSKLFLVRPYQFLKRSGLPKKFILRKKEKRIKYIYYKQSNRRYKHLQSVRCVELWLRPRRKIWLTVHSKSRKKKKSFTRTSSHDTKLGRRNYQRHRFLLKRNKKKNHKAYLAEHIKKKNHKAYWSKPSLKKKRKVNLLRYITSRRLKCFSLLKKRNLLKFKRYIKRLLCLGRLKKTKQKLFNLKLFALARLKVMLKDKAGKSVQIYHGLIKKKLSPFVKSLQPNNSMYLKKIKSWKKKYSPSANKNLLKTKNLSGLNVNLLSRNKHLPGQYTQLIKKKKSLQNRAIIFGFSSRSSKKVSFGVAKERLSVAYNLYRLSNRRTTKKYTYPYQKLKRGISSRQLSKLKLWEHKNRRHAYLLQYVYFIRKAIKGLKKKFTGIPMTNPRFSLRSNFKYIGRVIKRRRRKWLPPHIYRAKLAARYRRKGIKSRRYQKFGPLAARALFYKLPTVAHFSNIFINDPAFAFLKIPSRLSILRYNLKRLSRRYASRVNFIKFKPIRFISVQRKDKNIYSSQTWLDLTKDQHFDAKLATLAAKHQVKKKLKRQLHVLSRLFKLRVARLRKKKIYYRRLPFFKKKFGKFNFNDAFLTTARRGYMLRSLSASAYYKFVICRLYLFFQKFSPREWSFWKKKMYNKKRYAFSRKKFVKLRLKKNIVYLKGGYSNFSKKILKYFFLPKKISGLHRFKRLETLWPVLFRHSSIRLTSNITKRFVRNKKKKWWQYFLIKQSQSRLTKLDVLRKNLLLPPVFRLFKANVYAYYLNFMWNKYFGSNTKRLFSSRANINKKLFTCGNSLFGLRPYFFFLNRVLDSYATSYGAIPFNFFQGKFKTQFKKLLKNSRYMHFIFSTFDHKQISAQKFSSYRGFRSGWNKSKFFTNGLVVNRARHFYKEKNYKLLIHKRWRFSGKLKFKIPRSSIGYFKNKSFAHFKMLKSLKNNRLYRKTKRAWTLPATKKCRRIRTVNSNLQSVMLKQSSPRGLSSSKVFFSNNLKRHYYRFFKFKFFVSPYKKNKKGKLKYFFKWSRVKNYYLTNSTVSYSTVFNFSKFFNRPLTRWNFFKASRYKNKYFLTSHKHLPFDYKRKFLKNFYFRKKFTALYPSFNILNIKQLTSVDKIKRLKYLQPGNVISPFNFSTATHVNKSNRLNHIILKLDAAIDKYKKLKFLIQQAGSGNKVSSYAGHRRSGVYKRWVTTKLGFNTYQYKNLGFLKPQPKKFYLKPHSYFYLLNVIFRSYFQKKKKYLKSLRYFYFLKTILHSYDQKKKLFVFLKGNWFFWGFNWLFSRYRTSAITKFFKLVNLINKKDKWHRLFKRVSMNKPQYLDSTNFSNYTLYSCSGKPLRPISTFGIKKKINLLKSLRYTVLNLGPQKSNMKSFRSIAHKTNFSFLYRQFFKAYLFRWVSINRQRLSNSGRRKILSFLSGSARLDTSKVHIKNFQPFTNKYISHRRIKNFLYNSAQPRLIHCFTSTAGVFLRNTLLFMFYNFSKLVFKTRLAKKNFLFNKLFINDCGVDSFNYQNFFKKKFIYKAYKYVDAKKLFKRHRSYRKDKYKHERPWVFNHRINYTLTNQFSFWRREHNSWLKKKKRWRYIKREYRTKIWPFASEWFLWKLTSIDKRIGKLFEARPQTFYSIPWINSFIFKSQLFSLHTLFQHKQARSVSLRKNFKPYDFIMRHADKSTRPFNVTRSHLAFINISRLFKKFFNYSTGYLFKLITRKYINNKPRFRSRAGFIFGSFIGFISSVTYHLNFAPTPTWSNFFVRSGFIFCTRFRI